jgi:phosphatidate cytidylyltransferase
MTDRMDCQFLMGLWAYVYYSNLIRVNEITVASVLQVIRSGLTREEQFELLGNLNRLLTS